MSAQEILTALAASENNVAAGVAECLQALLQLAGTAAPSGPILIEFGPRTIALGRKRMGSMSGKVNSVSQQQHRDTGSDLRLRAECLRGSEREVWVAECYNAAVFAGLFCRTG